MQWRAILQVVQIIEDIFMSTAEECHKKVKIARDGAHTKNENEKHMPLRCELNYIV